MMIVVVNVITPRRPDPPSVPGQVHSGRISDLIAQCREAAAILTATIVTTDVKSDITNYESLRFRHA